MRTFTGTHARRWWCVWWWWFVCTLSRHTASSSSSSKDYVPPPEGNPRTPQVVALKPARGGTAGGTTVTVYGARLNVLRASAPGAGRAVYCVFGASHAIKAGETEHPDVVLCATPAADDAGVLGGGFASVRLAAASRASDGAAVTDGAGEGTIFSFVAAEGGPGRGGGAGAGTARRAVSRAGGTLLELSGGHGAGMRRDGGWSCEWRSSSSPKTRPTNHLRTPLHVESTALARCEAPAAPRRAASWQVSIAESLDSSAGARAASDVRILEVSPIPNTGVQPIVQGVRVLRAGIYANGDDVNSDEWCAFGTIARKTAYMGGGTACLYTLGEQPLPSRTDEWGNVLPLPRIARISRGGGGILFLWQHATSIRVPMSAQPMSAQASSLQESTSTSPSYASASTCASFHILDARHAGQQSEAPFSCYMRSITGDAATATKVSLLGTLPNSVRVLQIECICSTLGAVPGYTAVSLLRGQGGAQIATSWMVQGSTAGPASLQRYVVQPGVVAPTVLASTVAFAASITAIAIDSALACNSLEGSWLDRPAQGAFVSSTVASCEIVARVSQHARACSTCSLVVTQAHGPSTEASTFKAPMEGGTILGPLPIHSAQNFPSIGCRFGSVGPVTTTPLENGEVGCRSVARPSLDADVLGVQIGTFSTIGRITYDPMHSVATGGEQPPLPSGGVTIFVRALDGRTSIPEAHICTVRSSQMAAFVSLSALKCEADFAFGVGSMEISERHELILQNPKTRFLENAALHSQPLHATRNVALMVEPREAPSSGGTRMLLSLWTREIEDGMRTTQRLEGHFGTLGPIAGMRHRHDAASFVMPACASATISAGMAVDGTHVNFCGSDETALCAVHVLETLLIHAIEDVRYNDVRAGLQIAGDASGRLDGTLIPTLHLYIPLDIPSSPAFPNNGYFVGLNLNLRPVIDASTGLSFFVDTSTTRMFDLQATQESELPADDQTLLALDDTPFAYALTGAKWTTSSMNTQSDSQLPVLRSPIEGGFAVRHVISPGTSNGTRTSSAYSTCIFGTIGPILAVLENALERNCITPAMPPDRIVTAYAGLNLEQPSARLTSALAIAHIEALSMEEVIDQNASTAPSIKTSIVATGDSIVETSSLNFLLLEPRDVTRSTMSSDGGDQARIRILGTEQHAQYRCHFGSVSVVAQAYDSGDFTCMTPAVVPGLRVIGVSDNLRVTSSVTYHIQQIRFAPASILTAIRTNITSSRIPISNLMVKYEHSAAGFAHAILTLGGHPATSNFISHRLEPPLVRAMVPFWLPSYDGHVYPSIRTIVGRELHVDGILEIGSERFAIDLVSSTLGRSDVALGLLHGLPLTARFVPADDLSVSGHEESVMLTDGILWTDASSPTSTLVHADGGTTIHAPLLGSIPHSDSSCYFGTIAPIQGIVMSTEIACVSPALARTMKYGASVSNVQDARRFGKSASVVVQRGVDNKHTHTELPQYVTSNSRSGVLVSGITIPSNIAQSPMCHIGACTVAAEGLFTDERGFTRYACATAHCGELSAGFLSLSITPTLAHDSVTVGHALIGVLSGALVTHTYPPELGYDGTDGAAYIVGNNLLLEPSQRFAYGGLAASCVRASSSLVVCEVPVAPAAFSGRSTIPLVAGEPAGMPAIALPPRVPMRDFEREATWAKTFHEIRLDSGGDLLKLTATRSSGQWNCAVDTIAPLSLVAADAVGTFVCISVARPPGLSRAMLAASRKFSAVRWSAGPLMRLSYRFGDGNFDDVSEEHVTHGSSTDVVAVSRSKAPPPSSPPPPNATIEIRGARVFPYASPIGGGIVANLHVADDHLVRSDIDDDTLSVTVEFANDGSERRRMRVSEGCVRLSSTLLRCEVPSVGFDVPNDGVADVRTMKVPFAFFGDQSSADNPLPSVVTPERGPSSGGTPVAVTTPALAAAGNSDLPLLCRFDNIFIAARPCTSGGGGDGCISCLSPAHAPSSEGVHPLKRTSARSSGAQLAVGSIGGAFGVNGVPGFVGHFVYLKDAKGRSRRQHRT
ncbi:IPT/TIG domain-containing protein [Pseudoscourfieldia marina]